LAVADASASNVAAVDDDDGNNNDVLSIVNDDDCDGSAKVHGSCIKLMDGDFGTII
jgi:hypothetical protein